MLPFHDLHLTIYQQMQNHNPFIEHLIDFLQKRTP